MSRHSRSMQTKIGYRQVLLRDASVYSIQWMRFPAGLGDELTPTALLGHYLHHIRRFTLSLIRPHRAPGGELQFRLLGTRVSLISFSAPQQVAAEQSTGIRLSICGGVLVQRANCHRGEFAIIARATGRGVRVIVQLTDYCPLLLGSERPSGLRKLLYRLTQAYIHRVVTVRFLARLYKELTGSDATVRVVRGRVPEGEDI